MSSLHIIYEDRDGAVKSHAARSRDLAIHVTCEILSPNRMEGWSSPMGRLFNNSVECPL